MMPRAPSVISPKTALRHRRRPYTCTHASSRHGLPAHAIQNHLGAACGGAIELTARQRLRGRTVIPMASRETEKEQRRTERLEGERRAAASERRRRLTMIGAAVCVVIVLVVVVVIIAMSGSGGGKDATVRPLETSVATPDLPGAQTSASPWDNGAADQLQQRLRTLDLPALGEEGQVLHIHQHLDVFVNGKPTSVPAGIGIEPNGGFISPLHTHDDSGVLHVESPTKTTFTLGQLFGVWGVALNSRQLGALKTGSGKLLRAYVNGKPFTGDPGTIPLAAHQELAVAYGTKAQMPKSVPSSYDFPAGE
jgi:hypothetical protein